MRYWLRLIVVLTVLHAVAEDACPHWISVVPLKAEDAEGIVDDVVAQGNETIINGIAWICTIHPSGNPVVDKAAQYAETYRKLSPRVRAKSAVKQGILLQATMGHGGFPGEATPWQLTVRPDGKSVYRMCPLDPRFLDYIAKECRTFAALKPDFFMVDDDTRIVWDNIPGCFCPLHLKELEKATGRTWTREEVVARIKAKDAALLETWEKIKFDSLAALFRTIRANFDPETPGMFCTVSTAAHFKHAKTFAAMLAAPGQTPVVRGSGANYCGNDLFHPLQRRGQFAYQLAQIDPGVVYLQEADTCPQTLWSCSAAREYEAMVLQALEGVKGAKIWITRTVMTRERRSQTAYRRLFRENRGVMNWAAQTDFRMDGVVVPPAAGVDGFAERYLGLMGIPYRYGTARPGEVTALCRDNLKVLPREEIAKILSGAVLLDGTAANWLAANGFAKDIGVAAKPWARKTIQSHRDETGAEIGGMRVDAEFSDLTALEPGAQILSRLYNIPAMGATPVYEAPGSILFSNARGGRVLTFSLPLRSNRPTYYQSTMFSEGGKAWVVQMLKRLGCRLPAFFAGAGDVMCETGMTSKDGTVFVLNAIDIDTVPEPEMSFAQVPASIERLGGDGIWRPVSFTRTAAGTYVLSSPLQPHLPAIFRFRASTL
ncbi:MAG: hypothetical protein Q4G65_07535 [bacterium]|nr:hypothetical protein [bacterium]